MPAAVSFSLVGRHRGWPHRAGFSRWGRRVPLGIEQAQIVRASDAIRELLRIGNNDTLRLGTRRPDGAETGRGGVAI